VNTLPVLTLLSDYGLRGPYIAEVKGIILRIVPDATIVDISHDVRNHTILEGAFNLARSVTYFPENTIHMGLACADYSLDPKPIMIESEGACLVGFDNGLLAPAAEKLGVRRVYKITNSKVLPGRESDTFIGRDVIAPLGALLAKGTPPSELGTEISEYLRLPDFDVELSESRIHARVIHVDGFGNLVTNIRSEHVIRMGIDVKNILTVDALGTEYKVPFVRNYSSVNKGELLVCLCGGYLEVSKYLGNASKSLGIKEGCEITISNSKSGIGMTRQ